MNGELLIKEKRCKGCGICAAFCPKKVLEVSLLGKITPVRPEDCIACGQCEMRCPDFAIQGNEAVAEGAIAAGVTFFAGYPITPSTEIAEQMAKLLPKIGGTFLQMEDEIGAMGAMG